MTDQRPEHSALVFDLDGTLVDTNFQHALAWSIALHEIDVDVPIWKMHRRVGMSGSLLANQLARQIGFSLSPDELERVTAAHKREYGRLEDTVHAVPGASDLLATLETAGVPWAIATSGTAADAESALARLDLPDGAVVVTSDDVDAPAKPDPAIFLAAIERLGVAQEDAFIVGDSVWDVLAARRARCLAVGVLAGGYSESELMTAGAYRVVEDAHELALSLDLVGVHTDAAMPGPRG